MKSELVLSAVCIALFGCSSNDETKTSGDSLPPLPSNQARTEAGIVEGVELDGVRAFFGVPFAAPPVGDLRWKPPGKLERWLDVRPAKEFGPSCPQLPSKLLGAAPPWSEDCLTLNVWTPDPLAGESAPVVVFFHGGGFIWGGAAQEVVEGSGKKLHDGETLARTTGTIVVTANYRLGPFGFLGHRALIDEDPDYPTAGNYGVEDQRTVLEWVQNNIAGFGGDPQRVTLAGQSAGGVSVLVHMASPDSQGLFQQALPMSTAATSFLPPLEGTAPHPYPLDARVDQGERFTQALGCTDASAVLGCLRQKSADDVLNALPLREWVFYGPGELWLPSVDGVRLPKQPYQAILDNDFEHVPTMMGTTRDEGTVFVLFNVGMSATEYRGYLDAQFGEAVGAEIYAQYPPEAYGNSAGQAMMRGLGDFGFTCEARRTARALADAGVATYRYEFGQTPSFAPTAMLGAFHASDLFFFFNSPWPGKEFTGDEAVLSQQMVGYLGRFAHGGDPNDATAASWPAFYTASDQHLELVPGPNVESQLRKDACDFWDLHRL